jgi:hypothetical protein
VLRLIQEREAASLRQLEAEGPAPPGGVYAASAFSTVTQFGAFVYGRVGLMGWVGWFPARAEAREAGGAPAGAGVDVGLGRIVALCCRSPTSYQDREHIRCLFFLKRQCGWALC